MRLFVELNFKLNWTDRRRSPCDVIPRDTKDSKQLCHLGSNLYFSVNYSRRNVHLYFCY